MPAGCTDTIAAIATAPGRSAVAVLRVSGPGAAAIASAVGATGQGLEPRHSHLRTLVDPGTGEPIDQALVTWFPGPDSYTGEDVFEISSHGGTAVPALLLDALYAAGARPAERGEFTRRAFLNGKLNLLQIEATLDLIDASSVRMSRAAIFALERGLSGRVERLRERTVEAQALLAYDIDFPDEDDGPLERSRIAAAASELEGELEALLRGAPEGEMLREGALTVIAGRPNVGKSSLFNAMLGIERAIVTDVPGTTRDAIEALVGVDGYPFRLVDTAGLRSDAGSIEGMGIEVARAYLERADLVLVGVDAGRVPSDEERAFVSELDARLGTGRVLVVRTKRDLVDEVSDGARVRPGSDVPEIEVAAPRGIGLERLRAGMLAAVFSGIAAEDEVPLVTHRRHVRALEAALDGVRTFREAWTNGLPPEIAVTHLQDATHALEGLVGVVSTEDVLDALFAGFCVGK